MANKNKVAEVKEKILEYVKENGPLLPTDISKHMGGNLIFASAILSELVSNKVLRMSDSKIGGSRLYYFPGQEEKLVKVHDYLSERPRKAFDLLKENKVLRDSYCEPWERVALREIKDFAMPLTVKAGDVEELFWKWFTVSDEEADGIIKGVLESPAPKEELKQEEIVIEAAEEPIIAEAVVEETPKKKVKRKKKEEAQEVLQLGALHSEDEFTSSVLNFFSSSNIFVIDQKLLKRDKEINFVIEFPSVIGKNCYYVKARNKKRISDKEISEAFDEAKQENLPLLFLSNGELTKKAQGYISNNMRGIVFKQI